MIELDLKNHKIIILIGVPGSGKTTAGVELIKMLLKEGFKLNEITFTTFSRSGIKSIKDKLKKEGIDLSEAQYFKTLNSLTWGLVGLHKENELTIKDQQNFFSSIKVPFNPSDKIDKNDYLIGNFYINFFEQTQKKHLKMITELTQKEFKEELKDYCFENKQYNIRESELLYIHGKFIKWKQQNNKYTYSDSLIITYKDKIELPTKILFVDEAQDLNKLQIEIIKMWYNQLKKRENNYIVIAGDDDQAIHIWNGADPKFLINLSKIHKNLLLEKTYRLPEKISTLANLISFEISERVNKSIKTDKKGGKINYLRIFRAENLNKIMKQDKKTFLLFRANYQKNAFAKLIMKYTYIPFSFLGSKSKSKFTKKMCDISNALNKLENNEKINFNELFYLLSIIPSKGILKRGVKSIKIENLPSSINKSQIIELYFLQKYKNYFKNNSFKEFIIRVMDYPKKSKARDYNKEIRQLRENQAVKEWILKNKRIIKYEIKNGSIEHKLILGTYHSSKGLEAENVIIALNTPSKVLEINDEEKRVLYTAITRAKENLYLINIPEIEGASGIIDSYIRKLLKFLS